MKITTNKNGRVHVEGGKIRRRGTRTVVKSLPEVAVVPKAPVAPEAERKLKNARKRERRARGAT